MKDELCFAIYNTNPSEYSDNLIYINEQQSPENIQIECLSVEDAEDKYTAYNEIMMASDAKYKVYIESDTYIVNKNFVKDVIRIFQQDSTIGVIGILGAKSLPQDEKKVYGKVIYDSLEHGAYVKEYFMPENVWENVDTIEDILIVTSCDIPWQGGCSQNNINKQHCQAIQKAGYKIVVARQEIPWCLKETV